MTAQKYNSNTVWFNFQTVCGKRIKGIKERVFGSAIIDHNPNWKENQGHKRDSFWIRELQTLHPVDINKKA